METSRTPLILVGVLILLSVLYVGSYLALVNRGQDFGAFRSPGREGFRFQRYRIGGSFARSVYWPLEQIDRRLQPEKWDLPWFERGERGGVI